MLHISDYPSKDAQFSGFSSRLEIVQVNLSFSNRLKIVVNETELYELYACEYCSFMFDKSNVVLFS